MKIIFQPKLYQVFQMSTYKHHCISLHFFYHTIFVLVGHYIFTSSTVHGTGNKSIPLPCLLIKHEILLYNNLCLTILLEAISVL
jgi:hypothetical protein